MAGYVTASLLTSRASRTAAATPSSGASREKASTRPIKSRLHVYNIVGIDKHFNRSDRWVTLSLFLWSIFWFMLFVVGSVWPNLPPKCQSSIGC
jgi:hypothetical protein